MQKILTISPIARAIMVMGAVAALATAVTFAALDSTATLTDNSISTASANLLVDNTDNGSPGLGTTDTGFAFTNLVPGDEFSPAQHFALSNTGSVDLDVSVQATGGVNTGTGLDKSKVIVRFTNNNPNQVQNYSLAELEAGVNALPGAGGAGTLPDTETENFDVQVKLEDGALTGSGPVSFNDFDLVFVGTNEAEVTP